MKYRLGLDVGTNSLGWSVLELNSDDEPFRIASAGVRIFADGRDSKSKATLKANRREARSARKNRDRYLQRRTFLLSELTKAGLFPKDSVARSELQNLNPLKLRADALTTELSLYQFGRALFHLNQRRGFKSNRKDRSQDTTSGKISNSARNLLLEMGLIGARFSKEEYSKLSKEEKRAAREKESKERSLALQKLRDNPHLTFGLHLWTRQQQGKTTRARPNIDSKLYDVYPTRDLLEDEFRKIWNAQVKHNPTDLTDDLRDHIEKIIFFQRDLKPQARGVCSYLPDECRTFRAMPSFQRYRIFQEIDNLEWYTVDGRDKLIKYRFARDAVITLLERSTVKNAKVTFTKIRNELKKMDIIDSNATFNLESEKCKALDGNLTSNVMQHEDCVGSVWYSWPLQKQDEFIDVILNDELTDEEVVCQLKKQYGLSDFSAKYCLTAPLVEGTANLSLRASRLLMEMMRDQMLIQSDAVIEAANEIPEFVNPYTRAREGELLESLPYYGEVVEGHIIPGLGTEEDEQTRIGMVSNPTVHIAMNQLRQVVNELIDRFGRPNSIAIELARELPVGQEKRSEIERDQSKNQEINQEIDQQLIELGQTINRDNRLRIRLWKDQSNRCIFTGNTIGISDLFSGEYEIEHLIPFSISLDDSRANKVICTRNSNRDKGKRTPFEAFGESLEGYVWEEILDRVRDLPKPKQWRFDDDALEKWLQSKEFTERHLNDTRYIGRLAKEYLQCICKYNRIDVLTGRLTAILRGHWGLNSVLQEHIPPADRQKNKSRDDHRHHAVDAIVIGMTTRSMIQKVSNAANRAEQQYLDKLFVKGDDGKSPIDPWDGFRREVIDTVQNIVVSHKVRRKKLRYGTTDGQLHNDTAYGIISEPENGDVLYDVVVRWPVDRFVKNKDVDSIRDLHLRNLFLDAFDNGVNGKKGAEGVKQLAAQIGIRRLRRTEKLRVIPIEDKNGRIYKAYKGDSNWGIEIYEFPFEHPKAGKWEGIVISRFDANQSNFQRGCTKRPHPAAKLVMRLQINDCIEVEKNSHKLVMRLQKLALSGTLCLVPHNEANADARNRDKNDPFKFLYRQTQVLKNMNARKVHISPTGRVTYDKRR